MHFFALNAINGKENVSACKIVSIKNSELIYIMNANSDFNIACCSKKFIPLKKEKSAMKISHVSYILVTVETQ